MLRWGKKKNKNGDSHMEVMHSKSWDYLYENVNSSFFPVVLIRFLRKHFKFEIDQWN